MREPGSRLEPVARTRAFWARLGLPGLSDKHVHFLLPNTQAKVCAQFDQAGPKIGRDWPIRYWGSHQERVEQLSILRHTASLGTAPRASDAVSRRADFRAAQADGRVQAGVAVTLVS